MITIGGDSTVDAAIEGNRIAVRNFKGPFNRVLVDGIPKTVVKISPSLYVPNVLILTIAD